jgi:hypothetical protein
LLKERRSWIKLRGKRQLRQREIKISQRNKKISLNQNNQNLGKGRLHPLKLSIESKGPTLLFTQKLINHKVNK